MIRPATVKEALKGTRSAALTSATAPDNATTIEMMANAPRLPKYRSVFMSLTPSCLDCAMSRALLLQGRVSGRTDSPDGVGKGFTYARFVDLPIRVVSDLETEALGDGL